MPRGEFKCHSRGPKSWIRKGGEEKKSQRKSAHVTSEKARSRKYRHLRASIAHTMKSSRLFFFPRVSSQQLETSKVASLPLPPLHHHQTPPSSATSLPGGNVRWGKGKEGRRRRKGRLVRGQHNNRPSTSDGAALKALITCNWPRNAVSLPSAAERKVL